MGRTALLNRIRLSIARRTIKPSEFSGATETILTPPSRPGSPNLACSMPPAAVVFPDFVLATQEEDDNRGSLEDQESVLQYLLSRDGHPEEEEKEDPDKDAVPLH